MPEGLPISGHAELAGIRVHPVPYVDNGAPEDLRPPTVWTVSDGGAGRAVEIERRPGRVYGVEATSAGFIAAGYTGPVWERHRAMVWASPDGQHWSRMRIDSELGSVAGGIATNGLGTIVTGWFYVPQWATSPWGQYVWFSAGGTGPFDPVEPGIQLHGLEALADEFVGVGDCRGSDECVPAVVFGRRAEAAPTPSPSPKQIPLPTQTSIAGGTPRPCAPETIAGRLTFTDDRRFAVARDDGTLVPVIWPDGWYAQRTLHGMGLLTEMAVVALDGDIVRLGGDFDRNGTLFACREVEVIEGILVRDPETGFAVQYGQWRAGVRWPNGYVAREGPDGLELLDEDGQVVAREGDGVRLGGGSNGELFWSCSPPEVVPTTLTGILVGDPDYEGGCVWISEPDGLRWAVQWPEPYRLELSGEDAILYGGDDVVGQEGDQVTLRGTLGADFSYCGVSYDAVEVLEIRAAP